MIVPSFVDTNVLLYAEDEAAEPVKQEKAQVLLKRLTRERSAKVSLQVLQEYFAVATRKLKMDTFSARRRIEVYSAFDVVQLDSDDLLGAIDLHRLHGFSIWDALIVRAALISGCRKLYTEDLQAGFRIEQLEVVNPFSEV
jgi:predicted nucleic acid-binding protein